MLKKIILILFIFYNFSQSAIASIQSKIINNLININNLSFSFKQTIGTKEEEGNCVQIP